MAVTGMRCAAMELAQVLASARLYEGQAEPRSKLIQWKDRMGRSGDSGTQ